MKIKKEQRQLQSSDQIPLQKNIQIQYAFDQMTGLNDKMNNYIQKTIIPYVSQYYSRLLSVYSSRQYNFTSVKTCGSASVPSSYQTILNADYLMLVTTNTQGTGIAANCAFCQIASANKRPIMGIMTIFSNYFNSLDINSIQSFEITVSAFIHETLHCLGFSNIAANYFVDPTTNQLLGYYNVIGNTTIRGKTVSFIKLAAVLQYAQSYFQCNEMLGVELEDEGGSGTAGSHWERRIVKEDLMIGQLDYYLGMSNFTMNLLEGTGWYKINNKSMAHQIQYGKNGGCSFLQNYCVSFSSQLPLDNDNFCGTFGQAIPTQNLRSCGFCAITTNSTISGLASYFNYWSGNKNGGMLLNDNCPVVQPYSDYMCHQSDQSNNKQFQQYFGDSSFCITGTWIPSAYNPISHYGCLKVSCVTVNSVLYARIYITSAYYVTCSNSNIGIPINLDASSGYTGNIICPNLTKVCLNYNYQNYQTFTNYSVYPYDSIPTNITKQNYNKGSINQYIQVQIILVLFIINFVM